MPLGAGNQPAGLSPAGLGSPLGLPAPGAGFSKVFDVVDVRQIDPVSHDYVVDTTTSGGPHGTMSATYQRVMIALSTPLGQIQDAPTIGDPTLVLRKMPTDAQAAATTRLALKAIVDEGAIEILEIVSERLPLGTLARFVRWRDTATQTEMKTRAGT